MQSFASFALLYLRVPLCVFENARLVPTASRRYSAARPSRSQIEVQSRDGSCKLMPGPPHHNEFPSETAERDALQKRRGPRRAGKAPHNEAWGNAQEIRMRVVLRTELGAIIVCPSTAL